MPKLNLEPDWWKRARRLHALGIDMVTIQLATGKSRYAVRNCLDHVYRDKNKAKCARQHLHRKSKTGRVYDYDRQTARKVAREKYRNEGGDLRQIYREMECL